jgi:hypothetical protein
LNGLPTERRIALEDFLLIGPCGEVVKDYRYGDTCAFESGLSMGDFRIDGNVCSPIHLAPLESWADFRLPLMIHHPGHLTVCVTCVWAGVDSIWEQGKLEARKILENAAESPASSARFVGRLLLDIKLSVE